MICSKNMARIIRIEKRKRKDNSEDTGSLGGFPYFFFARSEERGRKRAINREENTLRLTILSRYLLDRG